MREGLVLNDKVKSFLEFDLGRMDESKFKHKILDVAYCKNLKLDIYYPDETAGPFPVILVIYGGGYVSGFKQDKFVEAMIAPIHYGYAVVVADYSLALEEVFPAQVYELKTAIRFIKSQAQKYRFDANNITLWGESAGAHLALLSGLSGDELEDKQLGYSEVNSDVQSIVAFYPPVDASTNDAQRKMNAEYNDRFEMMEEGSIFSIFIGANPLTNPSLVDKTLVKNYLHQNMPPLFIQHGLNDNVVPYQQSVEFQGKVLKYLPANKAYFEFVEGVGHTDPWFFTLSNIEKMIKFIQGVNV